MHDNLFRTVQEATEAAYDVLGELGRDDARVAYLARDLDSGLLTVLVLGFEADEIEDVRRLGPGVPVTGSLCQACGSAKEGWGDRCIGCVNRGDGAAAVAPNESADALLRSVRIAAQGTYDVLGALQREGGAPIYFARDTATGRLAGLTIQEDPTDRGVFLLALAWEGPRVEDAAASAPTAAEYDWPQAEPERGQATETAGLWEDSPDIAVVCDLTAVPANLAISLMAALDELHRALGGGGLVIRESHIGSTADESVPV